MAKISTKRMEVQEIVDWLKGNGAGSIVLRKDAAKITDGFLHRGTLANRDCLGTGPKERIKFMGKVAYPVEALAEFMADEGFYLEQVA